VRNGRERVAAALKAIDLFSWPSHANFLLIKVGEKHRDFVVAMRQRGILVRDRSSDPGCEGCVRITIGSDPQTARLVAALADAARELKLGREVTA
jgi:histidinol-phosphate aminotransferase